MIIYSSRYVHVNVHTILLSRSTFLLLGGGGVVVQGLGYGPSRGPL